MEINRNFKEFLQLLNEHEVKYLVIGGYAVNFHGYPRYTKDIDIWIWMDRSNVKKLIGVINAFGMESLQLDITDFSASDTIIQLGYEPYRIDLLLEVEGLDFEKSFDQRQEAILDEVNINFLNIGDLIKAAAVYAFGGRRYACLVLIPYLDTPAFHLTGWALMLLALPFIFTAQ